MMTIAAVVMLVTSAAFARLRGDRLPAIIT